MEEKEREELLEIISLLSDTINLYLTSALINASPLQQRQISRRRKKFEVKVDRAKEIINNV